MCRELLPQSSTSTLEISHSFGSFTTQLFLFIALYSRMIETGSERVFVEEEIRADLATINQYGRALRRRLWYHCLRHHGRRRGWTRCGGQGPPGGRRLATLLVRFRRDEPSLRASSTSRALACRVRECDHHHHQEHGRHDRQRQAFARPASAQVAVGSAPPPRRVGPASVGMNLRRLAHVYLQRIKVVRERADSGCGCGRTERRDVAARHDSPPDEEGGGGPSRARGPPDPEGPRVFGGP